METRSTRDQAYNGDCLSKKLKKKIEEICGLKDLAWEARQDRANQILASSEWKQSVCNDLIGLSFRQLEQVLQGIATERQKKEDSYQHKLDQYKKGKTVHEPKPPKRSTPDHKHEGPRARTLAEILAQVYAPRVVYPLPEEAGKHRHLFTRDESSDEVQPDSSDGADQSMQ